MANLNKQVVRHHSDAGNTARPVRRERFAVRPVQKKADPKAFAIQIEARFPLLMAELAK